jgi:CheY-like chemotaxis protein
LLPGPKAHRVAPATLPPRTQIVALDALAASSIAFDVILLDLRMPDMNGVEFIRAVRGTRFNA